ncbi:MAG: 50S ribosomal protein L13 [Nanoarchaeota archaeon]|nr:50S ribosomal protein L13 [Nanoarchaeota archaeon]
MNEIIIDANNAVLGRLASHAAKQSLIGKKVVIVNCEDAVIVGKPKSIIKEYIETRQRGGSSLKGPFFPKSPEKIVKRTLRGMLSYKQGRGRDALKRIICYNKTPDEYKEMKKIVAGKEKKIKTIKLKDLSEKI